MNRAKGKTVPEVFQTQVKALGDKACVKYKKDGVYTDLSWNQMDKMIRNLASYLSSIGVERGDRVGLFSENRYEWWVADQAILSIGAIDVPIYATNSSAEAAYVLSDSESKACLVATEEHLEKIMQAKKDLPKLENIVVFDNLSDTGDGVITLQDALKQGDESEQKGDFDKRLKEVQASDLATIMYTSGTTGNPKGVMLTHDNFVSNFTNVITDISAYLNDNELFLSFLPLSHVLERTCGYYSAVFMGATVAFVERIETLMDDMKAIRPTMLICVPRIYEKIRAGILAKVKDAPAIKKALFAFSVRTAGKNLPYACTRTQRSGVFAIRYNLVDKLVFQKLKTSIGMDRVKFAISGGAPLSRQDAEFFIGMGLEILEGYGLTETSPITNYNKPGDIVVGSVGGALSETDVKLSEEDEILIKGPQVMKGYYKNEEATKEVMTSDGYFKTGDIGEIDSAGRLKITGRIKDIIITAGGKNISPQNIENSLKGSLFIEQVAVIGEKRKHLSALVVPAFEALETWAKNNSINYTDSDELIKNEQVIKLIESEVEKYSKDFARVEQVKKVALLDAEWTQETGELTPSQKVKRNVVEKKYADEIKNMYRAS